MRRPFAVTVFLLLAGCSVNDPATPTSPAPDVAQQAPPQADGQPSVSRVDSAVLADKSPHSTVSSQPEATAKWVGPLKAGRWTPLNAPGKAASSTGPAALAVDGDRSTEWNPRAPITPGQPQWLAVPLSREAKGTLAIAWHGHALHYQNYDYGRPRTYAIQVSTDSTDGSDGIWSTARTITDNMVRSRVDLVDAPGARWVRLQFLTAWGGTLRNEPFLRDVMVYERQTEGAPDVWAIFGDSTTSVGLDPSLPDMFAPSVAERHPGYSPVLIPGGTGGDESGNAHDRLAVALPTLPTGSVVGLCYGTNDAKRSVSIAEYTHAMQTAIDQIRQAGDQPIVAVLPWSLNGEIANYANACKELQTSNGLPPGPDFYAYFKAHPEQLEVDKVHPNAQGIATMQHMWAETSEFRYPAPVAPAR